jgi:carbohydrate binding protein with CBM5/12 domain
MRHLTILPWPFTTVSAGTYDILQRSFLRTAGGDAMQAVNDVFSGLRTKGLYIFVDPDATAPDPSLGREDQFALQPDTGKLWLKTGGVWVFQGIYKGLSPKGPWDSGTAYNIGDIVSLAGTSYLALAASTNQTPPNAAYWQVLAAKGDTGSAGPQGASYGGTSTTSLTIGTGSKTFNGVDTGLAYQVGNYVRASSSANGANFMEGVVTAYSSGNITLNVTRVGGSGTLASWNLSISGAPGSGDLLSTNNLSDVASAATALGNLGGVSYGAAQSLSSGQVAQARANLQFASGVPDVIVEEQQPAGTQGGASTVGNQKRVLNTLVRNNGTLASLASNNVTLPAGTYYFKWSCPALVAGSHRTYLTNVTDSTNPGLGTSEYNASTDTIQTRSEGSAVVTIAASKAFALTHFIATARTLNGLGATSNSGATDIYSRMEIWKLG